MTGFIRIPKDAPLGLVVEDMLRLTGTRPAELARLTGYAEGQISKWRRGMVVPSAAVLMQIFDALGFDLGGAPRIKEAPGRPLSASVAAAEAEIGTEPRAGNSSGSAGLSGIFRCRRTVNECRVCEGTCEPTSGGEA